MSEKKETTPSTISPARAMMALMSSTGEGRILAVGLALSLVCLLALAIITLWSPASSRIIGALVISNITIGRAVSMSIGYAAGYGYLPVLLVNMITETVLVLLFYPIFVFSIKKLVIFKSLKFLLDKTHEAATRNEDKVKKYGIVGLFTFVWFPFWMTGPVVGCAIGYLLRFPAWLTMAAVLSGTYIAMIVWAWFLFGIQERAATLGGWAPALIVGIITLIIVLGFLLNRNREKK